MRRQPGCGTRSGPSNRNRDDDRVPAGDPFMTCQRCREEASIHLTETIDGRRRELHLCVPCARKAGVVLPEKPPKLALDQVVQTLIIANVGELVGTLAELTCPCCGQKFMEFRAEGRLGCPNDYEAFQCG